MTFRSYEDFENLDLRCQYTYGVCISQVVETEDLTQAISGIVAVAIYLYWVSSGAVACEEDGSHYRPNHHAKASQDVFLNLERMLAEALKTNKKAATQLSMAIRKVHPRLPSFAAEFMKSEPLTRIRDIAHGKGDRHGKCRDIRREIKTTLQVGNRLMYSFEFWRSHCA